jgi:peptidoglycan/LPS O-acetylase OafA/YrhL
MSEPAIGPLRLAVSSLFAAIAVNALTYCSERFRAPLTAPVLVWFGTLSFSIYVWQQLFASLGKFGAPTLTCLAMTLVCAILSFRLVENPARDYLNAQWGRRDAQPQRDLS